MDGAKSYEEIIEFIAAGTTPEWVIAFRPSAALQRRVAELTQKTSDSGISPEELSELNDCLQLEHIMVMARARWRGNTFNLGSDVTQTVRRLVAERAGHRCEYCLLHEDDAYFPHQVDHIVSRKQGGRSEADNLAFACCRCNAWKGSCEVSSLNPSRRPVRVPPGYSSSTWISASSSGGSS
jgi:hypothetical protein